MTDRTAMYPKDEISMTDTDFRSHIRSIADFPKPGILFRDITTLLENPVALRAAAERLAEPFRESGVRKVVVIESRGFLVGGIIAYLLGAGLVIIRKSGKLPYRTHSVSYALEYGTDQIEIHDGAIEPGERVLLHDDLLATGGTMAAAASLVQKVGGEIAAASFLVELGTLGGREVLRRQGVETVDALVNYFDESE